MQKTQTLAEAVSAYEKDKAQKSLAEKQTESRAARNSILNDARLIGTTARQLVAGIEKVSGDKASKARQLIDSFIPHLQFAAETAQLTANAKLTALEANVKAPMEAHAKRTAAEGLEVLPLTYKKFAEMSFSPIAAAIESTLRNKTVIVKAAARQAKIDIHEKSNQELKVAGLKVANMLARRIPGVRDAIEAPEIIENCIDFFIAVEAATQIARDYVMETGNVGVAALDSIESMSDAVNFAMVAIYRIPEHADRENPQLLPVATALESYKKDFFAWQAAKNSPAPQQVMVLAEEESGEHPQQ